LNSSVNDLRARRDIGFAGFDSWSMWDTVSAFQLVSTESDQAQPGAERDVLRDWNRVKMIRTLLVALYAKRIGYSGPINGWEADKMGNPRPASWWPHSETEEVKRGYLVHRSLMPEPAESKSEPTGTSA
jgi:hypothetical protein